MINTLKKTFEIDIYYSVNSFIYLLSKLPILRDLITNDIYQSKFIKRIVSIFSIIFSIGRSLALKFFYFFIIFSISYKLFPNNLVKSYFHIYFVLTIIGLFINNKLLNTNKMKYFAMIVFGIDGTEYFRMSIFVNTITSLIYNSIMILFFGYLIHSPIFYSIVLIIYTLFIRYIGEALNIMFYKKYDYIWYSNTKLYFTILISLLLIASLPYFNIFIPIKIMPYLTIIVVILGLIALKYLLGIKDYKLMYKRLCYVTDVMNRKYEKDYLRQAMVEVKNKDKKIDNKKIKGKKGYDLFNTIFFERHREILLRSARKYSFIIIGIYIVLGYFIITNHKYSVNIDNFLHNELGWFVVIMYFINRGAIVTQAMFFNCDHAMLGYNFYREPKVIIELFKKRLTTLVKVNLLPAFTIGIGNTILLVLLHDYNCLTIISTFLFIIFLNVFFSVYYLIIYYLLQPFNKNLEVKKMSYSFVTLGMYIISYLMTGVVMNSLMFSILGLVVTTIFIILSLYLVYKYAPKTFKLN